jgi:phosphatidylinositol-3-phosphatase
MKTPRNQAIRQVLTVISYAMKVGALVVLACLLSSACIEPGAKIESSPATFVSPYPGPTPSRRPEAMPHVFVIVMENHTYAEALRGQYTASLAAKYSYATNYHSVANPSLPNYLALTSGNTWGITDDGYHRLPATGLGAELSSAGIGWRAYMEGMTAGCRSDMYPYAAKHNPFAYYGGGCPQQVVPFTHFATDVGAPLPSFVWITPGLCHDGHDCPTEIADRWLSQTVPLILATPAWKQNGLLLITWDEGGDRDNHVLALVIRPNSASFASPNRYDHFSMLATIEDHLGVPRLGLSAYATPMSDLVMGSATP